MQQFALCRERLRDLLDVEPEPETVLLAEEIERAISAESPSIHIVHPSPPTDTLPDPGLLPERSRIPYHRNALFVGRREALLNIASFLLSDETQAVRAVAIRGMGGIGKTQLAVEYAYRYGRFFPGGVYWFDFTDEGNVPEEFAAIGDERGLALFDSSERIALERRVKLVQQVLQEPTPRLLIFDNCESVEQFREWLPVTGGAKALLTSRRGDWPSQLGVEIVMLDTLARRESVALLQQLAARLRADSADSIASEVGDLPLALHLVGSFLHKYQRISVGSDN